MRSAIVLGGSGLVGSRLVQLWSAMTDITAPAHAQLDVLDDVALTRFLEDSAAEVVVNASAWTDVDGAERETNNANGVVYRLNAALPGRLAELCALRGKYLVHLSTDYVFDGSLESRAYREDDAINPLGWYAETKARGEQLVRASTDHACIVRIEMPFSAQPHHKRDFARLCLARFGAGQGLVGVTDQRITPVFVDDAAEALARLIAQRATGVVHVAATTWTTPFDYARAIALEMGHDPNLVQPEAFAQFALQRAARRPRHSWLDVAHAVDIIGPGALRAMDEQLAAWAAQISVCV